MKNLYLALLFIISIGNLSFAQTATLSGHFYTGADEGLTQVKVVLIDNNTNALLDSTTTNNEGFYQFPGLPINSPYRVEPSRDGDDLNGVSTFDLVVIQRHIIGNLLLDSPLDLLAADVNLSNTITTLDLIRMRSLILASITEFTNAPSWRFVHSTIEFSTSQNPFEGVTNNDFTIILTEDVDDFDFIGIKTGDVNGSAMP